MTGHPVFMDGRTVRRRKHHSPVGPEVQQDPTKVPAVLCTY